MSFVLIQIFTYL